MGFKRFRKQSQFNAPVTVGKDDTGYDVIFYGATSGKYWQWDESADSVVAVGGAILSFTTGDMRVYASAASTLSIENNRTTGAILLGSTGSYVSVDQAGNLTLQDTNYVQFISADQGMGATAASTLNILQNRTAGTVRIGSTASYGSFSQDGHLTMQDAKYVRFIGADMEVGATAASTLAIINDRATGPIRVGSTASYATFSQAGNLQLQNSKQVQLDGGTTNYLGSGATNRVDLVTAGSVRVGSTTNYTQVGVDGKLTLVGTGVVAKENYLSPLQFDATSGSVGPSQWNSRFPSQFFDVETDQDISIWGILPVPKDAHTACDSTIYVDFANRCSRSGSGPWAVAWEYLATGTSAVANTGSFAATASYPGQYQWNSLSGAVTDHLVQGQYIGVKVTFAGTTASRSAGSLVDFLGLRWGYRADKLGV